MATYEISDDQGDTTEFEAIDDADAAKQTESYIREGNYNSEGRTFWIDASYRVKPEDEGEDCDIDWTRITVIFDPAEPECDPGTVPSGADHAWVDGEPRGHGGGVMGVDWCARCGLRRHWDTWALRRDTGEQGLSSVRYETQDDSDEETITERLDRFDVGDLDQTLIGDGDGWSVFLAEAPSPYPWYAVVEQTDDDSPDGCEVDVTWTLSISDAKEAALDRCESMRDEVIVSHGPDGHKLLVHDNEEEALDYVDWLEKVIRPSEPYLRKVFALPAGTKVDRTTSYNWVSDVCNRVVAR